MSIACIYEISLSSSRHGMMDGYQRAASVGLVREPQPELSRCHTLPGDLQGSEAPELELTSDEERHRV